MVSMPHGTPGGRVFTRTRGSELSMAGLAAWASEAEAHAYGKVCEAGAEAAGLISEAIDLGLQLPWCLSRVVALAMWYVTSLVNSVYRVAVCSLGLCWRSAASLLQAGASASAFALHLSCCIACASWECGCHLLVAGRGLALACTSVARALVKALHQAALGLSRVTSLITSWYVYLTVLFSKVAARHAAAAATQLLGVAQVVWRGYFLTIFGVTALALAAVAGSIARFARGARAWLSAASSTLCLTPAQTSSTQIAEVPGDSRGARRED
eukprot:TRINITY_DN78982_c0_g1_i1.p1 TRINITY_DN78982_c0_g1~~TRINITY_DN78982_c0_g1_i1.p1  ORF type:complete len:276 (-),score=38.54 TRINITY_DN78982_c0_g1_i1:134-940(-)